MPRDEEVDILSLNLDHDEVNDRRTTASTPKYRLKPFPSRSTAATAYKKKFNGAIYTLYFDSSGSGWLGLLGVAAESTIAL